MTPTTYELTEAEAWEQINAWLAAGYRIVWDKGRLALWTLYVWPAGQSFPVEASSTDREDLRVIDCVQRMRRLLAASDSDSTK